MENRVDSLCVNGCGGTIANLIALKIAADQANAALADVKASSPLLSLLGKR